MSVISDANQCNASFESIIQDETVIMNNQSTNNSSSGEQATGQFGVRMQIMKGI
jgi:hypothetical protein